MMKIKDLNELVDYALALGRPCAVPSKVWGQLKNGSAQRYEALGNNRLDVIHIEQKGDEKSRYADVDYGKGGVYRKVTRGSRKTQKIVAVVHVSTGTLVYLGTPLDPSYYTVYNNADTKAKF